MKVMPGGQLVPPDVTAATLVPSSGRRSGVGGSGSSSGSGGGRRSGLGESSGAGAFTIIRVHVLGNVLGPVFVYATGLVSVAMILASGLSFLGLGTKPPEPEWGLMLNTLRTAIYSQPLVAALPGAMIFVVSICFNLLSDGLRSAMDVKL